MGKREVGQLSITDLIVSLLIAELTVISIENFDKSILYSLIPIVILVLFQCILAFISLKKPKFRLMLEGNPSVIIKNGKINYNEMLKQRYNLDDLLTQLREKKIKTIEDAKPRKKTLYLANHRGKYKYNCLAEFMFYLKVRDTEFKVKLINMLVFTCLLFIIFL